MPGEERTRDLGPEIAEPDGTEQTSSFEHSIAVIIGINDYGHGIPKLTTAANDAARLAEILMKDHGYDVILLVDEGASHKLVNRLENESAGDSKIQVFKKVTNIQSVDRTEGDQKARLFVQGPAILETLETVLTKVLPEVVGADDRGIVYFAGHGMMLDQEDEERGEFGQVPYLIPLDANPNNRDTFLPMEKFHDWLTALKCRHMLLILDCCFAGAIRWSGFRSPRQHREEISLELYHHFIHFPAWQAITSAAYDQKALDSAGGYFFSRRSRKNNEPHSPFARALFDALSGKADTFPASPDGGLAGDGILTAYELIQYIRAEVFQTARQDSHTQTPGLWPLEKHNDKGEFVFYTPGRPLALKQAPKLELDENPYRGSDGFDEKHSTLFFGRGDQIHDLVKRVVFYPFTVVLGASGAGKSSLVKAGLIPRLGGSHEPGDTVECVQQKDVPHRWFILSPFCPNADPLSKLRSTLAKHLPPSYQAHATLDKLHRYDTILAELVAMWSHDHPDCKLVLVIDQFEQLITHCKNEKERDQFLSLLARAIETWADHIRLVIILRADLEPRFKSATPLSAHWSDARYVVPPMTQDDLRAVIEEPAWKMELYFEPKLVDELINDVSQMPGALPLLSSTLHELYNAYAKSPQPDRTLGTAYYETSGRVVGSLCKRANKVYGDLPDDAHRNSMRRVMLRMAAPEGGGSARQRVYDEELEYPCSQENQRVAEVTRRLIEANLVVTGSEEDGEVYFEPAHDALARPWDELLFWKDETGEYLLLQRQVTQHAREWDRAKDKDKTGMLWNKDSRLRELEKEIWPIESKPSGFLSRIGRARQILRPQMKTAREITWLNRMETQFVRESVEKRARDLYRLIGAVLVVILIVTGLTTFAGYQRSRAIRQTRIALARQLAAQAVSHLDDRFDLALLLSLEANQLVDQVEVRSGLLEALQSNLQLVTFLHGHESSVSSVAFSPDGKTLVSGSYDGTLILWDVGTHRPLERFQEHQSSVWSLAFSPDGHTLASGDYGGSVVLWDVSTGQILDHLIGHELPVWTLAFSPDGHTLVSGSYDDSIVLWDVGTRQQLGRLEEQGLTVRSVAFSPDGRTLASGDSNGSIYLWNVADVQSGVQLLDQMRDHWGFVWGLAFSPDGKTLASGSSDQTIVLWDLNTRQPIEHLTGHTDEIRSVAFSPSGETLVSGSKDGTIMLWDALERQPIGQPISSQTALVYSVAFSPDGRTLVSGGKDSFIVLWDIQEHQRLDQPLTGHNGSVNSVAFSPDGQILASGSQDFTTRLWDTATGQPNGQPLIGNRAPVGSVAFSPDGRILASGDRDIYLWDAATGQLISQGDQDARWVHSVTFSPDGQILASALSSVGSSTIILWDVATIQRKMEPLGPPLDGHRGTVSNVAFSPDGRTLASSGLDRTVILWDVATGQPIGQPLGHSSRVWSVAFDPSGQMLATGDDDFFVNLWDISSVRDGRQPSRRFLLVGHTDEVTDVAFSPDGQTLVSGSRDKTVMLWDVMAGVPIGQLLTGHSEMVLSVAFSPDGQRLASGGNDNAVILWDVSFDSWQTRACHIANRNLTQSEWNRFIGSDVSYRCTCPGLPPCEE